MKATRRTFMQAAAAGLAALFAPTVRLRSDVDREKLLAGFLDDDGYSVVYDHSKPYHLGGWTYATDARHMAWAELSKPDEDGGTRRIPAVEDVRRNLFQPARWVEFTLPPIGSLLAHDGYPPLCPVCGNRRISYGEHYPTEEWVMRNGYKADYDVDDNTIRDPSCEFCEGGKRADVPSMTVIGGQPFSYWRLRPIAAIPGVRVSVTNQLPYSRWDTPRHVLCFSGAGIEGVAMGLKS